MYERYLETLGNKLERVDKKHSLHASRFVGQDMYPQIDTAHGWKMQTVNGRDYIRSGELWVSRELFKIVVSDAKRFMICVGSMCLVESIIASEPCRLQISDTILDIEPGNDYNIIAYPLDVFTLVGDAVIEINYRELL